MNGKLIFEFIAKHISHDTAYSALEIGGQVHALFRLGGLDLKIADINQTMKTISAQLEPNANPDDCHKWQGAKWAKLLASGDSITPNEQPKTVSKKEALSLIISFIQEHLNPETHYSIEQMAALYIGLWNLSAHPLKVAETDNPAALFLSLLQGKDPDTQNEKTVSQSGRVWASLAPGLATSEDRTTKTPRGHS